MLNVEHGHLYYKLAEAAFFHSLFIVCAPIIVRHHALSSAFLEYFPSPGSRLLAAPTPPCVFLIPLRRPLCRDVG